MSNDFINVVLEGKYNYVVITDEVGVADLRHKSSLFENVTGVTIYVEANEKDLRWDDNFPSWSNGNKVIYGDKWTYVEFCDEKNSVGRWV